MGSPNDADMNDLFTFLMSSMAARSTSAFPPTRMP